MKFDLVCVDMFQTLVDVNARIPFIWKKILKEDYNEALAARCAASVNKNVFLGFQKSASSNTEFINLKTMFEPFFKEVFNEMNITFDANKAVKIVMDEHTKAVPYEDVDIFLSLLKNKIPVCLVSDADYEMISPIIQKYEFDEVFISEKVKSYKNEPSSRIFKDVIEHYFIEPNKILHIGDSASDIIGASRVGIKTCWINREDSQWKYDVMPDYIVKSLKEVVNIIVVEELS